MDDHLNSRWIELSRMVCLLAALAAGALSAQGQDSLPASEPASVPEISSASAAAASKPTSAPAAPSKLDLQRMRARTLWRMFLRAPNEEVLSSRKAVILFLRDIDPSDRLTVTEAMFSDDSDETTGPAGIALLNETWGEDWLSVEQLRKITLDGGRSPVPRMLLVWAFESLPEACSPQSQSQSAPAELASRPAARELSHRDRQLLELAVELVENLRKQLPTSVPAADSQPAPSAQAWTHSRQRLMVNILQPVLTCTAGRGDELSERIWQGLELISARGETGPKAPAMLLSSIDGWVRLHQSVAAPDANVDAAIAALGHWDRLVRHKAAIYLARRIEIDANYNGTLPPDWKSTLDRLRPALSDIRDEVKASAGMVLAYQPLAGGDDVIDKLVSMLLTEPGVAVQISAAEALKARADKIKKIPDGLLDVFDTSRLGPNRTECILSVLARLVELSDAATARRLTILAMDQLSTAPHGAMELLAALANSGMLAKTNLRDSAIALVTRYRDQADRLQRQYIDGQVLPALKK